MGFAGGRDRAGRVFLLIERMLPVTVFDFNTTPPIPREVGVKGISKRLMGRIGKTVTGRFGRGHFTLSVDVKSRVEFVPQDTFLSPLLEDVAVPSKIGL